MIGCNHGLMWHRADPPTAHRSRMTQSGWNVTQTATVHWECAVPDCKCEGTVPKDSPPKKTAATPEA